MELQQIDLDDLKRAKTLLENPGLAARITDLIGTPIEKGLELLPDNWNKKIGNVTQTALTKAVHAAVLTMKERSGSDGSDEISGSNESGEKTKNAWHKLAVAATGGIGGFFGLPAMSIELPVSTTIMMRSIADIARSEGEDIFSYEAKIACIEVFALGGPTKKDDATESGYFAVRASLAQSITRAAEYLAQKGMAEEGAPALIRLIIKIAERFSIQVTEKAAAQAVPAIGAAGGALINTLFIDHFQDMAQGHFIVRRLERKFGHKLIEETYKTL